MKKKPGPVPAYRTVTGRGYVALWMPDHPDAWKSGRIAEHRYVMEQHLGRRLRRDEHVHHKDENRQNNAIENLEILTCADHTKIHKSEITAFLRSRKKSDLQDEYNQIGSRGIAAKHNLSAGCVARILRTKGIQIRPPQMATPQWREVVAFRKIGTRRLKAMYREMGMQSIAEKHGISKAAVRSVLEERGIPIRQKGVSLHRPRKMSKVGQLAKSTLADLYKHHTMPEIAEMLGVAVSTVLLAMRRHGIETRQRSTRPAESGS